MTDADDKARTVHIKCYTCNREVILPLDAFELTQTVVGYSGKFGIVTVEPMYVKVSGFVSLPNVQCKNCLGVATVDIIESDVQ